MAFQLALEALSSTSHRDTAAHPLLDATVDPLRQSLDLYPWSLPPEHLPLLNSFGIRVSGLGSTPHPHPFHKTVETHLLFSHWLHLATTPSSILFMKPSKFRRLQRLNPNFLHLHNYRLTASDTARYPESSLSLPSTPTVFMHDAIMYFTPPQILNLFQSCPLLSSLHASLVVPPESHFTDLSLHPSLYQYTLHHSTLHYTPEGHHAGSYNQPISALSWLKIHTISSPSLHLSVSILESWGPCHSLLIQRGLPPIHPSIPHQQSPPSFPPLPSFLPSHPPNTLPPLPHHPLPHPPSCSTADVVSFRCPSALILPNASPIIQPLRHRLVPEPVYNSLFTYTRAVRTLRVSDPAGFVRTQSNKPEHRWVTAQAWDNLQTFALLTCGHRPPTSYPFLLSPLQKALNFLRTHRLRLMSWASILPSLAISALTLREWHFPLPPIPIPNLHRLLAPPPPLYTHPLPPPLVGFPVPTLHHPMFHLLLSLFPGLRPRTSPRLSFSPSALKTKPLSLLQALPLILLPQLLLLARHLRGPLTPQALHDLYQTNLHPPQFHLSWERIEFPVEDSVPFLPPQLPQSILPSNPPNYLPQPSQSSRSLFPPPHPPPPPPPAAFAPTHPTPPSTSCPAPSTESEAQSLSPNAEPAQATQAPPPHSLSAPSASDQSMTGPAPSSPNAPQFPPPLPSQTLSDPPLPSSPQPLPTPPSSTIISAGGSLTTVTSTPSSSLAIPLIRDLLDHPTSLPPPQQTQRTTPSLPTSSNGSFQPPSPPLPPPASLLSSPAPLPLLPPPSPPGVTPVSYPHHGTFHPLPGESPTPPLSSPPTSSLLSDPTAIGPILPFDSLFPAPWPPNSTSFLTRLRHHPTSNLPMPSKHCLLTALSELLPSTPSSLWGHLQSILPDSLLQGPEIDHFGLSTDHLSALCLLLSTRVVVISDLGQYHYGPSNLSNFLTLHHTSGPPSHFSSQPLPPPKLVGAHTVDLETKDLNRSILRFRVNGAYLPIHSVHRFTPSHQRAKNLISNMKNGLDGVLANLDLSLSSSSRPHPRERILMIDSRCDVTPPRPISLVHIAGFAGCGKTYPIQQLLKTTSFRHFRVSTPTTELRSEWKAQMKPSPNDSWRYNTWESSLLKSSQILVIDEIYKLPRGYLDLCILADPTLRFVILLGDPLQGEYHSTHPDSTNHHLESETRRLPQWIDYYCMWSYRIPRCIASLFSLPTFNEKEGCIRVIQGYYPGGNNLVNSQSLSKTIHDLGWNAITISSSQGCTYDEPSTIFLDRHTSQISPGTALVALTRSRSGVFFVGDLSKASGLSGSSPIFSAALSGSPISLNAAFPTLFHRLPLLHSPLTQRPSRLTGGFQPLLHPRPQIPAPPSLPLPPHIPTSYRSDFVVENPILPGYHPDSRLDTHHLPPTRLPLHSDLHPAIPSSCPITEASEPFSPDHSPVYPGESFECLAAHFLPAHDPDLREIIYGDLRSCQFPWLDRPFHLSCQPSSLLAARHSPSSDPTLLPASIPKRLRFRPSNHPYQFTPSDFVLGNHLYFSLCQALRRSPHSSVPFDPILFAECININEYAQLSSKTQATIVANHSRSDPDWRFAYVRIFAKSQHKVNDSSLFQPWKACQTLALMHDHVILSLGPVKKYQRVFDSIDRPSSIYSHCGKTPHDLRSWCQAHATTGRSITNDYTAFDQSQHGEAVVLEVLKMKRLNIPPLLIDLHIALKTHVTTQFGPLTCMRLTGEPGTYDDNTDYNLAVINLQYHIQHHPVMVSGDDSVIFGSPPQRSSWPSILPLLHLRFKTEHTAYPLFCGYYVGPSGAIRNPLALFAKLMICVDDQTLPDKKISYLTEFSVGHSLGDSLWSLLPPHLVPYQSAVFDFMCRHCTPTEKLILQPGAVPDSLLDQIASLARWASRPLYALLSSKARRALVSRSSLPSFPEDPDVSLLESELLPFFQ
nr:polyprotein [Inya insect-associated virus]